MSDEKKSRQETNTNNKALKDKKDTPPKEIGGRDGPDPVRYGDWENKGIASDF